MLKALDHKQKNCRHPKAEAQKEDSSQNDQAVHTKKDVKIWASHSV